MASGDYIRATLSTGELGQPESLAAKLLELARTHPDGRYIILELDWRTARHVTTGTASNDDL